MTTPTPEQLERLRTFAAANGRTWRSMLRTLWMTGADAAERDGHLLRQVRNSVGPSGLDRIDLREATR